MSIDKKIEEFEKKCAVSKCTQCSTHCLDLVLDNFKIFLKQALHQARQEAIEECIEAVGEDKEHTQECLYTQLFYAEEEVCSCYTRSYNQAKEEIREELNKLKS